MHRRAVRRNSTGSQDEQRRSFEQIGEGIAKKRYARAQHGTDRHRIDKQRHSMETHWRAKEMKCGGLIRGCVVKSSGAPKSKIQKRKGESNMQEIKVRLTFTSVQNLDLMDFWKRALISCSKKQRLRISEVYNAFMAASHAVLLIRRVFLVLFPSAGKIFLEPFKSFHSHCLFSFHVLWWCCLFIDALRLTGGHFYIFNHIRNTLSFFFSAFSASVFFLFSSADRKSTRLNSSH